MLFIVLGRHTAAVFIGKRNINEELFRELGLQFRHTIDDEIVEIEYRRLKIGEIQQSQIVGKLLLDFGSDGNAVVVVRKCRGIGEVGPVVNEGGTDGIVAN